MISIIIPCFNAGSYLAPCLESVLAQDFTDYEILAVNDGSSDDTGGILEIYAKTHENLRVITQQNKGASTARNNALSVAKGEFVIFLDSDDLLELGALKALYENSADCDIVIGDFNLLQNEQKILQKSYNLEAGILDNSAFFRHFCAQGSHFAIWGKLYKKSLLDEHKISFLEGVFVGEDVNFNAKAFYHAQKIKKINNAIISYRIGENNASKDFCERHFMDAIACADDLKKFAQNDEINALCLRLRFEAMLSGIPNTPKLVQKNIYKAPFNPGFRLLSKRLKAQFLLRILLGNALYQRILRILRKNFKKTA